METTRQETLDAFFSSSPSSLRPIMTSLNGDNSWLLSFPRPAKERESSGRAYFHLVFEPWLVGPVVVLNSWLVHTSLPVPPAISTREALEGIVKQIEKAAVAYLSKNDKVASARAGDEDIRGDVDAILLSLDLADHAHVPSLLLFDSKTPVIGTTRATWAVNALNHFETVLLIPEFTSKSDSWRSENMDGQPPWLNFVHLAGHVYLNFCLAMIWTHSAEDGSEIDEVIFYTPHGTRLDQGPIQAFLDATPSMQKLAMVHGLKESHTWWFKTTWGVAGGLDMWRMMGGAKYWLPTHGSLFSYAGLIMRSIHVRDTPRTLEWGLEDEARRHGKSTEELGGKPNFSFVDNGASFVLA